MPNDAKIPPARALAAIVSIRLAIEGLGIPGRFVAAVWPVIDSFRKQIREQRAGDRPFDHIQMALGCLSARARVSDIDLPLFAYPERPASRILQTRASGAY